MKPEDAMDPDFLHRLWSVLKIDAEWRQVLVDLRIIWPRYLANVPIFLLFFFLSLFFPPFFPTFL